MLSEIAWFYEWTFELDMMKMEICLLKMIVNYLPADLQKEVKKGSNGNFKNSVKSSVKYSISVGNRMLIYSTAINEVVITIL